MREVSAEFSHPDHPQRLHDDPGSYLFRTDTARRILWLAARSGSIPVLKEQLFAGEEGRQSARFFNGLDLRSARMINRLPQGGFERRNQHWREYARDADGMRFVKTQKAARNGQLGVRMERADFNRLWTLARVHESVFYTAQVYLRGRMAQAARAELRLDWYDKEGNRLPLIGRDRMPAGHYPEWQLLAVPEQAPAGARYAAVVLSVRYMEPDDYLDIDDFALLEWSSEE